MLKGKRDPISTPKAKHSQNISSNFSWFLIVQNCVSWSILAARESGKCNFYLNPITPSNITGVLIRRKKENLDIGRVTSSTYLPESKFFCSHCLYCLHFNSLLCWIFFFSSCPLTPPRYVLIRTVAFLTRRASGPLIPPLYFIAERTEAQNCSHLLKITQCITEAPSRIQSSGSPQGQGASEMRKHSPRDTFSLLFFLSENLTNVFKFEMICICGIQFLASQA